MKRIIGKVLISALFAGGTVTALAGPSSALPRDACMDEIHYFQMVSWLESQEIYTFDVWAAWGAAVHDVNPVSGESWTANLPSGYETVFTQTDYSSRFSAANTNAVNAAAATVRFETMYSIC